MMKQHLKRFGLIPGLMILTILPMLSMGAGPQTAQAADRVPTLKEIRSFEVEPFTDTFTSEAFNVNPLKIRAELVQQTSFVLNNERRLPKGSPAEGLIKLSCVRWPDCNTVKMSVLYRPTGQEIWSTTTKSFRFFVTWWFDSIPRNTGDMAKDLISQLTAAYESH